MKRNGETKWHLTKDRFFCRFIRINHDDLEEDGSTEGGVVDLTDRSISVMDDGQVLDSRMFDAYVVGSCHARRSHNSKENEEGHAVSTAGWKVHN